MDESQELTGLDPRYVRVMQFGAALFAIPLAIGALVLETTGLAAFGVFLVPALLIGAILVFVLPGRRFRRWGYRLDDDRLRIVRGFMFHSDTLVPLGRVQHIDVEQGLQERRYGLATLTVHTAGTHNSSVRLPGLRHEDALAMRDAIRAHIAGAIA